MRDTKVEEICWINQRFLRNQSGCGRRGWWIILRKIHHGICGRSAGPLGWRWVNGIRFGARFTHFRDEGGSRSEKGSGNRGSEGSGVGKTTGPINTEFIKRRKNGGTTGNNLSYHIEAPRLVVEMLDDGDQRFRQVCCGPCCVWCGLCRNLG